MAQKYVVGDENCSITKVINVMSNAEDFEYLKRDWMNIALELGATPGVIVRIEHNISSPSCTASSIMLDILTSWRAKASKEAKLDILLNALEKWNQNNICAELRKEFKVPAKDKINVPHEATDPTPK